MLSVTSTTAVALEAGYFDEAAFTEAEPFDFAVTLPVDASISIRFAPFSTLQMILSSESAGVICAVNVLLSPTLRDILDGVIVMTG